MSVKFVCRYSVNYFITNIRKMLAIVLLLLLVEAVCGTAAYLYGMIAMGRDEIADVFTAGEEDLAVLTAGDADPMRIIDALKMNSGIEAWGQSTSVIVKRGEGGFFSALGPEDYYTKTSFVINLASVGMMDIVKTAMNTNAVKTIVDNGRLAVFVSEDYRNRGVNIGDQFEMESLAFGVMEAEIVGYLQNGFLWLNSQDFASTIPDDLTRSEIRILAIASDEMIEGFSTLLVKKGPKEEWKSLSEKVVSDFAIDGAALKSFSEMLKGRASDTTGFREYLRKMLILLVCVSVLTIISVLTVATIQSRKVFGVWYANGASQRDVVSVLAANSLFLYILATSLMIGIGSVILPRILDAENWLRTKAVFFHYAVPMTISLVLAIVVLGTIFPIILVRREPPSELVKGFVE